MDSVWRSLFYEPVVVKTALIFGEEDIMMKTAFKQISTCG